MFPFQNNKTSSHFYSSENPGPLQGDQKIIIMSKTLEMGCEQCNCCFKIRDLTQVFTGLVVEPLHLIQASL